MPQRASVFCNFYIRVDREALVSERALDVGSVAFKATSTKSHFRNQGVEMVQKLSILCKHRNQCRPVLQSVVTRKRKNFYSAPRNVIATFTQNVTRWHFRKAKFVQSCNIQFLNFFKRIC
jgi:hypothetical protein